MIKLTSVTQTKEEEPPDADQPAVQPSLFGGQLMDGGGESPDVVVHQHCTHLTTTPHAADVTHLHKNKKHSRFVAVEARKSSSLSPLLCK